MYYVINITLQIWKIIYCTIKTTWGMLAHAPTYPELVAPTDPNWPSLFQSLLLFQTMVAEFP